MRSLLTATLLILTLAQPLVADVSGSRNVRLQTEWIEIQRDTLAQLTSGKGGLGKNLHAAVQPLIANKQAKLVHSSLVLARSSQRCTIQSAREIISPTGISGSGLSGSITQEDIKKFNRSLRAVRPHPLAFETRNVGCILEMEPTLGEHHQIIDLYFDIRWIQMPSIYRWVTYENQWGQADIKRAIFYTMRSRSALTLRNGHSHFVCSFNAMNAEGKADPDRLLLLFVKASAQLLPTP